MRTELAQPGLQFVSHHTYDELFTMHGSTMIYLVPHPGRARRSALYLVPLQVGAAEIAAPRLALAGFVALLGGGIVDVARGSSPREGAGRAGWTAFDPALGRAPTTPGVGMDLWILGVLLGDARLDRCIGRLRPGARRCGCGRPG